MWSDFRVRLNADDCLRIGFRLHLPMRVDGSLPLPVCVETPNPLTEAECQRLRIQTVRQELGEDGEVSAFTEEDDPFDENYGAPFYGILRCNGFLDRLLFSLGSGFWPQIGPIMMSLRCLRVGAELTGKLCHEKSPYQAASV